MNPEHHGQARGRRGPLWSPDVQVEAIFAAALHHLAAAVLGASSAERSGVAHAGPGFGGQGSTPAQIANRGLREGNVLERSAAFIERRAAKLSITQRVKAAGYHVFKAGIDAEFSTFDINKGYTGGVVWRRSTNTTTGAERTGDPLSQA